MDRNPPGSFGYGIFPDQGPNPSPLFCEHGLLASGSPGWSPKVFLAWALYDKVTPTFASIYTWPSSLCVSLCPNFPGLMRTWVTGLKPVLKGSSELDYTCTDYIGIPCFTVLLRIMLCKQLEAIVLWPLRRWLPLLSNKIFNSEMYIFPVIALLHT